MEKAAQELGDRRREPAVEQQKKAIAELEDQKYKIGELKRRIEEKAAKPMDKQAGEQGELADRTEKLGKQMGDQDKTPGQPSVSSASKSMAGASKQLGKGKAGEANEDQKKAIEDLQKAREELADAIEQEQEIAQAEQLAKIDQLLQKILDRQVKISASTKAVHGHRAAKKPHYRRPEQLKLTEMSNGEGRLAADIKRIRDMLLKEGNTVVFPEVLREVRGDLQDVQKLLSSQDAGPFAQGLQQEIERSLQEMIDAIRKELAERRRKQQGGGGQCQGGGGKQPLVPPIAELKMLRTLQLGINRRTRLLNKQQEAKQVAGEKAAAEHKKLGERQESVRKMAESLKEKMMRRPAGM